MTANFCVPFTCMFASKDLWGDILSCAHKRVLPARLATLICNIRDLLTYQQNGSWCFTSKKELKICHDKVL